MLASLCRLWVSKGLIFHSRRTVGYLLTERERVLINSLPCTEKRIIYAFAVVLINRLSYLNHLHYSATRNERGYYRESPLHSTLVESDSYLSQIKNKYPQRFRFGQAGAGPRMV